MDTRKLTPKDIQKSANNTYIKAQDSVCRDNRSEHNSIHTYIYIRNYPAYIPKDNTQNLFLQRCPLRGANTNICTYIHINIAENIRVTKSYIKLKYKFPK